MSMILLIILFKYMILQKIEMTFWSPKMYCIHFSHFMNVITMNTGLLQFRRTVLKFALVRIHLFVLEKLLRKEKLFCTKGKN